MTNKTILISGGNGKLAAELNSLGERYGHRMICPDKRTMDVRDKASIDRLIDEAKPDLFVHCAATLDDSNISLSLETNIIGTVNVVSVCMGRGLKLIYISTDYVYPKNKTDHAEDDPLLPVSKYAWTKMGGECAVQTYCNSLIVRGAICPSPYPHQQAYTDVHKNMIYQDEAARFILALLDETGVVNLGSASSSSLYDFATQSKPDVEPAESPPDYKPKQSFLQVKKLLNLLDD